LTTSSKEVFILGKSIDVSSGYVNVENGLGGGPTAQNYFDMSTARGVSSYDITQVCPYATRNRKPL
jgi:hypothetical protein